MNEIRRKAQQQRIRNSEIISEWTKGKTLRELGLQFGLSPQRIHQILLDNPNFMQYSRYRDLLGKTKMNHKCPICGKYIISKATTCGIKCGGKLRSKTNARRRVNKMEFKFLTAMRHKADGDSWEQIAFDLGYSSGKSCKTSMRKFAKTYGFRWDINGYT